ncbi:hypothetical protein EDD86DRAFT_249339 [Gorgonomyces haynaldii]|nr:hypothetical protein EDD86DRAFT_249339 [Gorgonomyces haynaldii]
MDHMQWYCKECSSWNKLDQFYASEPINGHLQEPTQVLNSQSLFCSICTHNQSLVMKLMAQYDPPKASLQDLEDYKHKLEERHPPLCETCEPKINQHMQVIDKRLHSWLRQQRIQNSFRDLDQMKPKHRFHLLSILMWSLCQLLVSITILIHLMLDVLVILFPVSFELSHDILIGSLFLASPLFIFSNPAWILEVYDIQAPDLAPFRQQQLKMCFQRLYTLWHTMTEKDPLSRLLSHSLLLIDSLYGYYRSYNELQLKRPIRIKSFEPIRAPRTTISSLFAQSNLSDPVQRDFRRKMVLLIPMGMAIYQFVPLLGGLSIGLGLFGLSRTLWSLGSLSSLFLFVLDVSGLWKAWEGQMLLPSQLSYGYLSVSIASALKQL